jgi:hypothetical protein
LKAVSGRQVAFKKTGDLMSNGRVRELEGQIAELKSRWPAHSVPPTDAGGPGRAQLEELEEELERELRKAAEGLANAQADGPDRNEVASETKG